MTLGAIWLPGRVARWYTYFQTQNTTLGKFNRAFERKRLVYFLAKWNSLGNFAVASGNPAPKGEVDP
jgi:hypothetical protein